jgi:hypothetical protein
LVTSSPELAPPWLDWGLRSMAVGKAQGTEDHLWELTGQQRALKYLPSSLDLSFSRCTVQLLWAGLLVF